VATGASDAVGPVVLIVSFEVPDALLTDDGLNLQVGGAVVAEAPFRVMLPQESATLWLNPPTDVIVTVLVADPPDETDVGEGAGAESEKPGTGVPVPDTATCCEPVPALSVTIRFALDPPAAVGANVTLIVQFANG
jgi:hypothetical protein